MGSSVGTRGADRRLRQRERQPLRGSRWQRLPEYGQRLAELRQRLLELRERCRSHTVAQCRAEWPLGGRSALRGVLVGLEQLGRRIQLGQRRRPWLWRRWLGSRQWRMGSRRDWLERRRSLDVLGRGRLWRGRQVLGWRATVGPPMCQSERSDLEAQI